MKCTDARSTDALASPQQKHCSKRHCIASHCVRLRALISPTRRILMSTRIAPSSPAHGPQGTPPSPSIPPHSSFWVHLTSAAGVLLLAIALSVPAAAQTTADATDPGAETETQTDAAKPIVDMLRDTGQYNTFVQALEQTGLDGALADGGPYTVFAPTDAAFEALGQNLSALEPQKLVRILRQHIIVGTVTADDLTRISRVQVVTGDTLTVGDNGASIAGAAIASPDQQADNGVVHGVDTVLMPSDPASTATPDAPEAPPMPPPAPDTTERDTTEQDTTEQDTTGMGSMSAPSGSNDALLNR